LTLPRNENTIAWAPISAPEIFPTKGEAAMFSTPLLRIRFWTTSLLALGLFAPAILQSQKRDVKESSPKYDIGAEVKLKGTVEELKLPPTEEKKQFAMLIAKSGDNTVEISLCPRTFLDDMGISFTKGDQLEITGSKTKLETADIVLAREIVKGSDTFVLRDKTGKPVW
jgi:hypothetical protein